MAFLRAQNPYFVPTARKTTTQNSATDIVPRWGLNNTTVNPKLAGNGIVQIEPPLFGKSRRDEILVAKRT